MEKIIASRELFGIIYGGSKNQGKKQIIEQKLENLEQVRNFCVVMKVSSKVESPCWIWPKGINGRNLYGHILTNFGQMQSHRFTYELRTDKPFPDGMDPDHICEIKACCNPYHIEPISHSENIKRSIKPGRYVKKDSCIHGHKYTEENTYHTNGGKRLCKQCGKDRYLARTEGRTRYSEHPEARSKNFQWEKRRKSIPAQ